MKKALSILSNILISLGDLYQNGMYKTAGVLVQNMSFCADKFEEEDFNPYLNILLNMKMFNTENHVLQFAYDEASMIIQGHFMSKDIEDSDDDIESTHELECEL